MNYYSKSYHLQKSLDAGMDSYSISFSSTLVQPSMEFNKLFQQNMI